MKNLVDTVSPRVFTEDMATTATTLTEGRTYVITYEVSPLTHRAETKKLTVTTAIHGSRMTTYVCHGPRGSKVVIGAAEIIHVEVV